MSDEEKFQSWFHRNWRPAMGWMYMIVCIFDFIIFPILWVASLVITGQNIEPWKPLTLEGAAFFHIAMGGVLGITSYSRGQEKMAMLNKKPSKKTPDLS